MPLYNVIIKADLRSTPHIGIELHASHGASSQARFPKSVYTLTKQGFIENQ